MDTGKGMMLPGALKMWERGRGSEGSREESKGRAGKGTQGGQGTWRWKEGVGRKGGGKKENGGR